MATVAIEEVIQNSKSYPLEVQRRIRRHQLAYLIRDKIKRHLSEFGTTLRCNLGPVDWVHDPRIFGFESHTNLQVDHVLEGHVDHKSALDVILGDDWDVRELNENGGFRIILTLRIDVDWREGGNLIMFGHTFWCKEPFRDNYRQICMETLKEIGSKSVVSDPRYDSPDLEIGESMAKRQGTVSPEWDSFEKQKTLDSLDKLEVYNAVEADESTFLDMGNLTEEMNSMEDKLTKNYAKVVFPSPLEVNSDDQPVKTSSPKNEFLTDVMQTGAIPKVLKESNNKAAETKFAQLETPKRPKNVINSDKENSKRIENLRF